MITVNFLAQVDGVANFVDPTVIGVTPTPTSPTPTPSSDLFDLGTAITGSALSSQYVRSFIVAGITGTVAISVINAEYRVNNGVYTAAPGVVSLGDDVDVRVTASSQTDATIVASVTVDTFTDTLSVTTLSAQGMAPQLVNTLPSTIEIPVGSYFELDLNDYFSDADSLLDYTLAAGEMPEGLSIDPFNGLLFGTPSISGGPFGIIIRATEQIEGRFTDSNTVNIEITGLRSTLGYPSKRHHIFRDNGQDIVYSQKIGEAVKYSWSFERQANALLADIDNIEWSINNGSVSNILRDDSYTSSVISINEGVAVVKITATFSTGEKRTARMRISSEPEDYYLGGYH